MDKTKLLEWLEQRLEDARNMKDDCAIRTFDESYCAGLVDATKSIIDHIKDQKNT